MAEYQVNKGVGRQVEFQGLKMCIRDRIIDTVKQGQQVTVVETWHKYLLIVDIDTQTQEPKSGFVLKKYFR